MGLLRKILTPMILIPMFVFSVFKGCSYIVMALIFNGRSWVFDHKTRDVRPACMNDPSLGTHKTVRVKGLNFHAVVSGNPQNPLMLFLHGYPESWYSWRYQIREFNKEYYCVAIDMRGAGETDAPLGIENYRMDELVGDVKELINVLGYTSCVLVGHDWGGAVAWQFVARHPELVDRLINMNIPHPSRFGAVMRSKMAQLWMSWYILFFQIPRLPEVMIGMGDYLMMEKICKKVGSSDDDVEAFKYSMSRPGRATSFLNYYRAAIRSALGKVNRIKCPTLLIWGTGDHALHTDNSYGTEKYCDDLTVQRIEGADHFVQQHKPDIVNDFMRQFLAKS